MYNNIIHRYFIRYSKCTIKYLLINFNFYYLKLKSTITVTITDCISMDYIIMGAGKTVKFTNRTSTTVK